MATPKLNPKQEKFCQLYHETGNATQSYRDAYGSTGNDNTCAKRSHQLLNTPGIAARLDDLRAETRQRHAITVDMLIEELEEARVVGAQTGNPSAMVSATMGKAKLLGLEAKTVGPSADMATVLTDLIAKLPD